MLPLIYFIHVFIYVMCTYISWVILFQTCQINFFLWHVSNQQKPLHCIWTDFFQNAIKSCLTSTKIRRSWMNKYCSLYVIRKSFCDVFVKLFKWPTWKATGPSNMLNPILSTSCHYRKQGFWALRHRWAPTKQLINRCWLRSLLTCSLAQLPSTEVVTPVFFCLSNDLAEKFLSPQTLP